MEAEILSGNVINLPMQWEENAEAESEDMADWDYYGKNLKSTSQNGPVS